jgi:hypothetical protein
MDMKILTFYTLEGIWTHDLLSSWSGFDDPTAWAKITYNNISYYGVAVCLLCL